MLSQLTLLTGSDYSDMFVDDRHNDNDDEDNEYHYYSDLHQICLYLSIYSLWFLYIIVYLCSYCMEVYGS